MTNVRVLAMTGAVFAAVVWFADQSVGGQGSLPPRLADYVTRYARLTAAEQAQLLKGQPVAKVVESPDPSREVGVFGAVWIAAPISRYVTAVRNIEQFEKGDNFLVTKRISSPPRIEDFAQLKIPPDDLADLKSCRVGACELKVSERALAQVKKEIDWSKPTAAADVKRLIAARVVVSKMLYASHYFWTALELRVLTPDPKRGEGFWFATVSQSRSDGLSGFVGSLVRGKVQGEAREGIEAVLRTTKARMEQR